MRNIRLQLLVRFLCAHLGAASILHAALATAALALVPVGVHAQTAPQKSFPIRGFHIDMRIQVMKMPALKALAADLRKKGINTLLIEWEASYPFRDEPIIANRYAYTRSEIIGFTQYCKGIGLDVIPLQQSFGHVEYILRHPRYAALREDDHDLSQVCPAKLDSNKKLFTALYKDLISTHSSPYIHIGCDETHLLGHCPLCRKKAAEEGLSKLYFDHVKMLCDIVTSLGKIPVLWADIALKYPEYIKLLPRQTVLVDWNYGWDIDRFGTHEALVNSGYEIWGAPALRSDPDNYFLTCWQRHFSNIEKFIPQCAEFGYKGVIMTSWSTSGEYDAIFDSHNDLEDLHAVRHVYPLGGFNLLIDAFIQALAHPTAFRRDEFIASYCRRQYGFDEASSRQFQKALFRAPYRVVDGKPVSPFPLTLQDLLDSAGVASRMLHSLRPLRNQQEFDHYRLMADIRVYYLRVCQIEAAVNAAANTDDLVKFMLRLTTLMATEPVLDREFLRLNNKALYPSAISEENYIRAYKTHELLRRLTKAK